MKKRKQSTSAWFPLALGMILTLMILSTLFGLAGPPLTQAGSGLPTRHPTPREHENNKADASPIGAYLELHAEPARDGLWTVVQWQDSAGGWHDVEGWRGTLDASGAQRWWVAAKDFGTGPFRWAIYQAQGGELLSASDPFSLPQVADEITSVTVRLGP